MRENRYFVIPVNILTPVCVRPVFLGRIYIYIEYCDILWLVWIVRLLLASSDFPSFLGSKPNQFICLQINVHRLQFVLCNILLVFLLFCTANTHMVTVLLESLCIHGCCVLGWLLYYITLSRPQMTATIWQQQSVKLLMTSHYSKKTCSFLAK